ncbi:CID domain [Dillenia turbinata]|uniref:CID domain n=1 Tax=Dillenia turbinata TaxID=194707 RepID=A0AAN8YY85_9MAGN
MGENPRDQHHGVVLVQGKAMANDVLLKPTTVSIADRFRALLKEKEDEIRGALSLEDIDDVPVLSTDAIVRVYEVLLSELTINSKPIITDLTIIAGEQREHGGGIADAICARISEVPIDQKLPALYLLDSIVKNIGGEYIQYFSSRLPEIFCGAYRQVHPSMYSAMRHLFRTWSAVFPPSVLRKIEAELQFSPSVNHQSSGVTSVRSSESPRPAQIHVNPKYLNIQNNRGSSPSLKIYGQNPGIGYDDYDNDLSEVPSSQVGADRISSGRSAQASFMGGADSRPSSNPRLLRPLSPTVGLARSVSPRIDEFALDGSPRRVVGRASPSYPLYDYGLGEVVGREEERGDWWKRNWPDSNRQKLEPRVAYGYGNGHERQSPRALIDAYGHDRRKIILDDKPMRVERLDINGMDRKGAMKAWQSTEEEEFDWEDMSPTLADHRSNDRLPLSMQPVGSVSSRHSTGLNAASLELHVWRSNLSGQPQPSKLDDSPYVAEDVTTIRGSGCGLSTKISGLQSETTQIPYSGYPQGALNLLLQRPRPLLNHIQSKGMERSFHALAKEIPPHVDNVFEADGRYLRPPTIASRLGSSGLDNSNVDSLPSNLVASGMVGPAVNVSKSQLPHLLPIHPQQNPIRSQSDFRNMGNPTLNPGTNKSLFLSDLQLDFSNRLPLIHYHPGELISLNRPNQAPIGPQYLPFQKAREGYVPSAAAPRPTHSGVPHLNHGYTPMGHGPIISSALSNPVPSVPLSLPVQNINNSSMHLQGVSLPPLPPGPPVSLSVLPIPDNASPFISNQQTASQYSGLFSCLMQQGLISLTKHDSIPDSMGLEFNPDILKVRHESAIRALYADLPRQCTTCGLRFKSQEEHSSHMDWHVTKNRVSKNRKQKPSRKWFVNTTMWLSGAEALGQDSVPGFLPTETVVEKKDDEEMAVPADEDQRACALCGEPFDDFYSDETEEWMYKGAVYMNAPSGSTFGMDRSQLGPIVHAKCRSESSSVPLENFGQDDRGNTDEGSERKRLRS